MEERVLGGAEVITEASGHEMTTADAIEVLYSAERTMNRLRRRAAQVMPGDHRAA